MPHDFSNDSFLPEGTSETDFEFDVVAPITSGVILSGQEWRDSNSEYGWRDEGKHKYTKGHDPDVEHLNCNSCTWHNGLDVTVPVNTDVRAGVGGVIKYAHGVNSAEGISVYVIFGDNYSVKYQHLSKILVEDGSVIENDTVIALTGETGVGGPHLHIEVNIYNHPNAMVIETEDRTKKLLNRYNGSINPREIFNLDFLNQ